GETKTDVVADFNAAMDSILLVGFDDGAALAVSGARGGAAVEVDGVRLAKLLGVSDDALALGENVFFADALDG
ncbi:MAG: hypothetical protein AAFU61_08615, partial [Pseudomonadota bacterium]